MSEQVEKCVTKKSVDRLKINFKNIIVNLIYFSNIKKDEYTIFKNNKYN